MNSEYSEYTYLDKNLLIDRNDLYFLKKTGSLMKLSHLTDNNIDWPSDWPSTYPKNVQNFGTVLINIDLLCLWN